MEECWKADDLMYIETRSYKSLLDKVRNRQYVIVIGDPGIGKTITSRHIALQVQKEGYTFKAISDLEDMKKYCQTDSKLIFLLEDVFGIFGVDVDRDNGIHKIVHYLGEQSKLIMTCRKSVFNKVMKYMCKHGPDRIDEANVFDLQDDAIQLTNTDKKNILAKHSGMSEVEQKKFEHLSLNYPTPMFPLMCKMFAKHESYRVNGETFFKYPVKYISQELDKLQSHKALQYATLVMCALNNNCLSKAILDSDSFKIMELKRDVFDRCKVQFETVVEEIINALSWNEGIYTMKKENCFTLLHTFLCEAILYHFGKQHPDLILKFMSSTFIFNSVCLGKNNETDMKIQIQEKHYLILAERLYEDIQSLNLHDVFTGKCLDDKEFTEVFLQVLSRKSYDEIKSVFLFEKQKEYSLPSEDAHCERLNCRGKLIAGGEQSLLVNKRNLEDRPIYIHSTRVVRWIALYGHNSILQHIIDRVTSSNESTDVVFGSDTNEQTRLLILASFGGVLGLVQTILQHTKRVCLFSRQRFFEIDSGICSTPLTAACQNGNVSVVEILLKSGCDINEPEFWGYTPLTAACYNGHLDVFILLLESKADIYKADDNHYTPLTAACHSGHIKIARMLIDCGCDVNKVQHRTPLTAACEGGNLNIVTMLIESGSDINIPDNEGNTPLVAACLEGRLDIFKKLIESGCDVNKYDSKFSPLTAACTFGHIGIVNNLIELGCALNEYDGNGITALIAACENGSINIVTTLLESGCDIKKVDRFGTSGLLVACRYSDLKIVELLIDQGCDMNVADNFGFTPLIQAIDEGSLDIITMLVEFGCDVNKAGTNTYTPLTRACRRGELNIVTMLVKSGCDVNQSDKEGCTPLWWASSSNSLSVIRYLTERGANVDKSTNTRSTPLHACLLNRDCNTDVINLLIVHGAEINCCDTDNKSPLYVYVETLEPRCDIINLLVTHGADVNLCEKDHKSPLYAHVASGGSCDVIRLLIAHGANVNLCDKDMKSPLYAHVAYLQPSCDVISLLITNGADVNLCDKDNNSVLPVLQDTVRNRYSVLSLLQKYGTR